MKPIYSTLGPLVHIIHLVELLLLWFHTQKQITVQSLTANYYLIYYIRFCPSLEITDICPLLLCTFELSKAPQHERRVVPFPVDSGGFSQSKPN